MLGNMSEAAKAKFGTNTGEVQSSQKGNNLKKVDFSKLGQGSSSGLNKQILSPLPVKTPKDTGADEMLTGTQPNFQKALFGQGSSSGLNKQILSTSAVKAQKVAV